MSGAGPMLGGGELDREIRRLFRRLIEPGCYAAILEKNGEKTGFGVFVPRNKWRRPVASLSGRVMSALLAHDLMAEREGEGGGRIFVVTNAGAARYRRSQAAADPFRAQHQLVGTRTIRDRSSANTRHRVNEAETPIGWLRRRKGTDGKPLISDLQYQAGERLREDFTCAHLTPRVTYDWSTGLGFRRSKGARTVGNVDLTDRAIAAKRRFEKALEVVGPGLGDVLVEVCCHLNGLECSERLFGWPQRSGKVVLQIALDRLATHYGLIGQPSPTARSRSWVADLPGADPATPAG